MDIINTEFLPEYEWTARYVKNAFGVDEIIRLPQTHWKHFDWLASTGADMDQFTMDCDMNRHINQPYRISFSRHVCRMLVRDEARRHRAGDNVPLYINPDRCPEEKVIRPHEEIVDHEVTTKHGDLEVLRIPRGYSQYLDWLGRHGTDVKQFVIDADRMRDDPARKHYTLWGMLQELLYQDEKRRYFSDEPSPLFISPDGYDE